MTSRDFFMRNWKEKIDVYFFKACVSFPRSVFPAIARWKATHIVFGQPIRISLTNNSRRPFLCVNNACKRQVSVRASLWSGRVFLIFRLGIFFSFSHMVANMHPETAAFQGGLRVYKIVMLGEGGVGKSGTKWILIESFFVQWNVKKYILQSFCWIMSGGIRTLGTGCQYNSLKQFAGFYGRFVLFSCSWNLL